MKKIDENSPTTKKDLDALQTNIIQAIDTRLKQFATKNDLDDAVAQIVQVVSKTLEEYPTKEDLNGVEQRLSHKIDKLSYDVSDLRNRVVNLEITHGAPHAHPV